MNRQRPYVMILIAFFLTSPAHLALGGIWNVNTDFLPNMITGEVDYIFYDANIITIDELYPIA